MRYLLCALALAGCDGESPDGSPASVALITPADGARVCGSPLVVEVEVTGITLVDPYDPPDPIPPDSGHLDIELNGQGAAMIASEHVDLADVEDGKYLLEVELSDAHHDPLVPYAGDQAYIEVDAATCADRSGTSQ